MSKAPPLVAIVDDEASVRRAFERLLSSMDIEVETYASGQAFLDSLKQHKPDCILLDLHMPGVSGFEVQDYINAKGLKVPIIVITGHESDEARTRAMAGGAVQFMLKPVSDVELLQSIRATFERSS